MTRSHAFSRALRQPHVITSSFDWFNVLSVSYVIGQSNYFGFGFTTLKRKPLCHKKNKLLHTQTLVTMPLQLTVLHEQVQQLERYIPVMYITKL